MYKKYKYFIECMNYILVINYGRNIMMPLNRMKQQDIEMFKDRSDFNQVKLMESLSVHETYRLRH